MWSGVAESVTKLLNKSNPGSFFCQEEFESYLYARVVNEATPKKNVKGMSSDEARELCA